MVLSTKYLKIAPKCCMKKLKNHICRLLIHKKTKFHQLNSPERTQKKINKSTRRPVGDARAPRIIFFAIFSVDGMDLPEARDLQLTHLNTPKRNPLRIEHQALHCSFPVSQLAATLSLSARLFSRRCSDNIVCVKQFIIIRVAVAQIHFQQHSCNPTT